ncbi:MAG: NAD+ synthase [Verrucomicrobia bacterium]|nr:NAD+ synthase [Verrucomicrobiota bacterium]
MKICMAQLDPTIGDLEGNTKKILKAIKKAKQQQADIVLFPELSICGYLPADLLLHDDFVKATGECLNPIIKASAGICVVVGLVRRNPGKGKPLFNSAAIIYDGQVLGYHNKCLLPTYNVFDERRYFEPGKMVSTFEIKGKKIAVIICEDIWQHSGYVESQYPYDPVLDLVSHKPDILLNLSASPYQFDKPDIRIEVCANAARTLNCPVLLCCQVGGNDDLIFDGYSVCVDKHGHLRQLGKAFKEDCVLADLDAPVCNIEFHYHPMEDMYKALVLGVSDYFAKQGFTKALIGLSGGVDSALVACIAKEALGPENVLGVAMPSRYSSKESVEDARKLAENLGIGFKVISIEGPFEDYLKLLQPVFEGKPSDVTEENLQSRIRGMILMAISNKLGYIVLNTGNKSELGVGYCTLYGDMCGGLGVISDMLKAQVYEMVRWVNRKREIIPQSTIDKAPSAELRPNQKDTDSLPEYDIVDKVMIGYIEDHLSAKKIAKKYQIPQEVVDDLIHRIHAAEYKRRQGPPGLRVSKRAFSVGRRFPIVHHWRS